MNTTDTIILEGTIHPDQVKTYLMLPFDMPSNVVRLDVAYDYTAAIGSDPYLSGGNTIDIGIFDSRGSHFMDGGFRGWSGSARSEFYLSAGDATPGYMPGPLYEGTWHICLGAYKVSEKGCDYRISIKLMLSKSTSEVLFQQRLELSNDPHPTMKHEPRWYKGELHCHSFHSDGDSAPLEVVRNAESLDLDFLAITDHNVLSQQISLRDLDTQLLLIPGMEVTTYWGHWNIWGTGDWIDFRVSSEHAMQHTVDAALQQGYLISCNHPRRYGPEWVYTEIAGFNCIEVWNGPWELFNNDALTYWEQKLRKGKRYVAVGGSDCHFLKRDHHAKLGHPTTYVYLEDSPSPAAILAAIRAGHVFLTESPNGPQIFLNIGNCIMGDTLSSNTDDLTLSVRCFEATNMQLEVLSTTGVLHQVIIQEADWEVVLDVDVKNITYLRAQLVSERNNNRHIHALTNPIYIQLN